MYLTCLNIKYMAKRDKDNFRSKKKNKFNAPALQNSKDHISKGQECLQMFVIFYLLNVCKLKTKLLIADPIVSLVSHYIIDVFVSVSLLWMYFFGY